MGRIDEAGIVRSDDGTYVGAASRLFCVRDLLGNILGAVDASGMLLDTNLQPHAGTRSQGAITMDGADEIVGFVQGQPPPMHVVCSADGSELGTVAWCTSSATSNEGNALGCLDRSGRLVNVDGQPLNGYECKLPPGGPSKDLPQALASSGSFLGFVLLTGAVVNASGHQV
jgi:hypothetical protein